MKLLLCRPSVARTGRGNGFLVLRNSTLDKLLNITIAIEVGSAPTSSSAADVLTDGHEGLARIKLNRLQSSSLCIAWTLLTKKVKISRPEMCQKSVHTVLRLTSENCQLQ